MSPPRVFSSLKDAWSGVLSGSVPPRPRPSRRRVSCPTIDAPQRSAASPDKDVDPFECTVYDVQISTEPDAPREEVDLGALTEQDFERLKAEDPFLYYSIPSLRRKSYKFDTDMSSHGQSSRSSSVSRRRMSLPAEALATAERARSSHPIQEEEPQRRTSVVRSRRLSTEAHPMLVCEEMLRELEALDDSMDDSDDDDCILGLLGKQ